MAPGVVFSYAESKIFCCSCDTAIHAGKSQQECPRFLIFSHKLPPVHPSAKSSPFATGLPHPTMCRTPLEFLPPPTLPPQHPTMPSSQMTAPIHGVVPSHAISPLLADDWLTGVNLADDFYDATENVANAPTPPLTAPTGSVRLNMDCAAALAAAVSPVHGGCCSLRTWSTLCAALP